MWEGYLHGLHEISKEPDSSATGDEGVGVNHFLISNSRSAYSCPRSLEYCQHGGSVTWTRQEDNLTTHLLSFFGFREENLCNESPLMMTPLWKYNVLISKFHFYTRQRRGTDEVILTD